MMINVLKFLLSFGVVTAIVLDLGPANPLL